MKKTLHKAWIHLFIAGLCSLAFGIIVLAVPDIPLSSLLRLFAAYMIIKGLSLSLGAWQTRHEETYWLFLLWYGILNVVTGIVASAYPGITLIILSFIVAINLFMSGVLQIVMAFHLCKQIRGEAWLLFSGVVAVLAGVYVYVVPKLGTLTILYLIAIAALAVSLFLISISIAASRWHEKQDNVSHKATKESLAKTQSRNV